MRFEPTELTADEAALQAEVREFIARELPRGSYEPGLGMGADGDKAFSKKITWVGKAEKLPLKEEYYDRKGRLERVFRAENIEEIDGYLTVTVRTMENVRKNHKSTVAFGEISYDVGYEDNVFTERRLKNPPADLVSN